MLVTRYQSRSCRLSPNVSRYAHTMVVRFLQLVHITTNCVLEKYPLYLDKITHSTKLPYQQNCKTKGFNFS